MKISFGKLVVKNYDLNNKGQERRSQEFGYQHDNYYVRELDDINLNVNVVPDIYKGNYNRDCLYLTDKKTGSSKVSNDDKKIRVRVSKNISPYESIKKLWDKYQNQ